MKITAEHISHMRDAIAPLDTETNRAAYRAARDDGTLGAKDADKRFRHDLMRAAQLSAWVCDTLYPYANDTHVDTALRSIVTPLGTGASA